MFDLKHSEAQFYINEMAKFRTGTITDLGSLLQAVDVGILALKYRDKKLPLKYQSRIPFAKYYRCPRCRKRIDEGDCFCRKCGQGLKW